MTHPALERHVVPGGPLAPVGVAELGPAVELPTTSTLGEAAAVMVERRVPAVLIAAPRGLSILAERDVVAGVAANLDGRTLAVRVATPDPVMVSEDSPLLDAVLTMLRRDVRALPVCNGHGAVVGLLSLRQALEAVLAGVDVPSWLGAFRGALRISVTPVVRHVEPGPGAGNPDRSERSWS